MTSLLSQRTQFSLNYKKIIALKIDCKIVAFFSENYPSGGLNGSCRGLLKMLYSLNLIRTFKYHRKNAMGKYSVAHSQSLRVGKETPLDNFSLFQPSTRLESIFVIFNFAPFSIQKIPRYYLFSGQTVISPLQKVY